MSDALFPGTATPTQVLTGQTFSAGTNYAAPGTMPNNGAVTLTPSGTGTVPIPAGYHNGSGDVTQVSVPAADLLSGQVVAGVAGTMPNQGAVTLTPSGTGAVAIPAGYHNGAGVVSQVSVPAADLLSGQVVAGVAGTMPNATLGAPITPGTANQGIPAGYHAGTGNDYVAGDANLAAANIKNGVPLFGVTGTLAPAYFASGTVSTDANGWLAVSGLGFTPKAIGYQLTSIAAPLTNFNVNGWGGYNAGLSPNYSWYVLTSIQTMGVASTNTGVDTAFVTNGAFSIPVGHSSSPVDWYAYG